MQMRRDLFVLEREHELDEARNARRPPPGGRCWSSPNRSPAADRGARPSPSTAPSACTSIGSPSGVPGAVRFDVVNLRRLDAALVERLADHGFLRRPVGRRQPAARAVLVDGRAADHREDAIAVRNGIRQALEHDDAAALASHEAVARPRRRSCSGRRTPPCAPASTTMLISATAARFTPPASATSALAGAQALTRQVHGDERRGARRVDRHARSLRARARTTAVRPRCCAPVPDIGVRVDARQRRASTGGRRSPSLHSPTNTPLRLPVQLVGRLAGVLERLPADFEQQSLLRIHRGPLRAARCRRTPARTGRPASEAAQRVYIFPGASGSGS